MHHANVNKAMRADETSHLPAATTLGKSSQAAFHFSSSNVCCLTEVHF